MGAMQRMAIPGELTIFTAQALKAQILAAMGAGGDLELDLAMVGEMDSAGVQLLVAAKREAAARGQTLAFTNHSPAVVDILDLCDLSCHFGDPVLISRA